MFDAPSLQNSPCKISHGCKGFLIFLGIGQIAGSSYQFAMYECSHCGERASTNHIMPAVADWTGESIIACFAQAKEYCTKPVRPFWTTRPGVRLDYPGRKPAA